MPESWAQSSGWIAAVNEFLKCVPTMTNIYEFSKPPEGPRSRTGKLLSNIIHSNWEHIKSVVLRQCVFLWKDLIQSDRDTAFPPAQPCFPLSRKPWASRGHSLLPGAQMPLGKPQGGNHTENVGLWLWYSACGMASTFLPRCTEWEPRGLTFLSIRGSHPPVKS